MVEFLTAGGDGGRFDLGKIRFWAARSVVAAVRLYELDGGSGGDRGLRLTSGERYRIKQQSQTHHANHLNGCGMPETEQMLTAAGGRRRTSFVARFVSGDLLLLL